MSTARVPRVARSSVSRLPAGAAIWAAALLLAGACSSSARGPHGGTADQDASGAGDADLGAGDTSGGDAQADLGPSPDGGGDGSQVDIPQEDVSPGDTTTDGVAEQPVELGVVLGDAPVDGAGIIVSDQDGGSSGCGQTNAGGQASLAVPAGGMLTVVVGSPDDGVVHLFTVVGVQPGDPVAITGNPLVTATDLPTLHVVMPDSPPDGASGYSAFVGSCGAFTPQTGADIPALVSLAPSCLGTDPTHVPVLALAQAFDLSTRLGYAFGQAVDPLTATPPPTVSPTPWRTDLESVDIAVTGSYEGVDAFTLTPAIPANGALYSLYYASSIDYTLPQAEPITFDGIPGSFDDGLSLTVELQLGGAAPNSVSIQQLFSSLPSGAVQFDLGDFPPGVTLTADDSGAATVLSWEVAGGAAFPFDGGELALDWFGDTYDVHWDVVLPSASSGSFTLPDLQGCQGVSPAPALPGSLYFATLSLCESSAVDQYADLVAGARFDDVPEDADVVRRCAIGRWFGGF